MGVPQNDSKDTLGKDGKRMRGHDQQQGDLQDGDSGLELPEGLKEPRKGPLNKTTGRRPAR